MSPCFAASRSRRVSGQHVLLTERLHVVPLSIAQPHDDVGLAGVGGSRAIHVEPQRGGGDVHQDRTEAGADGIGEAEAGGLDRKRVGQRRAAQQRERGTFVSDRIGTWGARGARGSLCARRPAYRPADLDPDRAEAAVGRVVGRRVGEQVVELVVFVDPPERPREIVGSLDQEPAGVAGQSREAGARIEPERVLDALHRHAERLFGPVHPDGDLCAPLVREGVELLPGPLDRALGAEAFGVNRVDGHVRAVRRVDHEVQLRR